MNWSNWLEKWNMTSLKFKTPFLEMDWNPSVPDKDAAWELYIELLTRIATQKLSEEDGDEKTALENIHSLFSLTRSIIKSYGRNCIEFTKIAIVVLNQVVRPFTAKWHKTLLVNNLQDDYTRKKFRSELSDLQEVLTTYTKMLADMAGVEDLSKLEYQ